MISPLEALVVGSACTEHWPAEAQEPLERGMTRVLHADADAGASNCFSAITVSAPIRAPARLSISGQMPRRWISF
jgi:hypothetical protein